jgi:hypothetical protein
MIYVELQKKPGGSTQFHTNLPYMYDLKIPTEVFVRKSSLLNHINAGREVR